MDRRGATAPSHKRAIQALLWGIKPLVALSGSIPFPYVLTFLTVAVDEGTRRGRRARNERQSLPYEPVHPLHRRPGAQRWSRPRTGHHKTDSQLTSKDGDLLDGQGARDRGAGLSKFEPCRIANTDNHLGAVLCSGLLGSADPRNSDIAPNAHRQKLLDVQRGALTEGVCVLRHPGVGSLPT